MKAFENKMKITSPTNQKIKDLVKLRDHRSRVRAGLTIIDGIREVRRAVSAGVALKEIFICPELYEGQAKGNVEEGILKPLLAKKVLVCEVTREVFEKICFGDRAEGVLALGQPAAAKFSGLKVTKNSLFMITESIEKPGNLGAILRTCDAAGISAVFTSDPKTDIFNPNVIRASMGTVFLVPVVPGTTEEILDFLRKAQVRIVAATPSANKGYTSADFRGATAIAIGSETAGLSDFWLKAADDKVFIPMKGQADSLNTSVAAALMAYEALRQRQGG